MNIFKEIWSDFRPYLVKFAVDVLVAATMWLGLFLVKVLAGYLPVTDWAGEFFLHLHSAGTVVAFGVFMILFVLDIIRISRGRLLLCFV